MKKALTFVLASCCLALGFNRQSFAQENASRATVSVAAESGSKEQDRLNGPVRRVRVETTKIILKDGNWVEGPREVLGIATYDPTGRKIDSVAYPVEGSTMPGNEHYLYDDKGNIVEMILRSSDGSMLSKESYKYEFDQLGNWTKMSSSVAIYENGKITFEPTAITYRSISYYFNQAIEKLNAPSPKSNRGSASRTFSTLPPNTNASSTNSPRPLTPTTQASTTIKPLSEIGNADARKELVTAPASVVPAKSSTAAPDGSVATSSAIRTTPDNPPATSVVQHVAEEDLRNAALELPKPEYSDAALLARASGKVSVQILVDEKGHVTNAQATSGHPLLGAAAEAAARKARFALTEISFGAKSVYGVISYEFVPPPTPAGETISATRPTIDRNPPKPVDLKSEERPTEGAVFVESKPKASVNYSEASKSFYDKGVAFQASGRHKEAAEAFNEAVRVDPNHANAYGRLAMSYSELQKHKEAIAVYKMAVQTDRSVLGAQAYYKWGHSYLALEKTSEALSAFKKALNMARVHAIDPERKDVQGHPLPEQLHYAMGIAYLQTRRFGESIDQLKRVVSLNPKKAEGYYALALAYLANGNRREAERHQRTLSSLDSNLGQKIANALAVPILPPGCRNILTCQ